jgi:hypothetical protein
MSRGGPPAELVLRHRHLDRLEGGQLMSQNQ